ncbi:hypothetical protein RB195_025190 [Necator americanus]|uniref:Endonuclease/exonuclease/phosphatase domain-containing protein n=1 Tax=Necator americanus TaxID=51031 RepID=A0ABR1ER88_NECAM
MASAAVAQSAHYLSSTSSLQGAHAPTETAVDDSKDAFYDELNALMSKIPSQQVVIVGIDANAKMGLEQQSDVLGKWYYAAERTSDNGDRLLDHVLERNIPQSDIGKSRAVWDVAFDTGHRPVLLSFKIRFHKRNRDPLQLKIDVAGLKDEECRTELRQRVSIHVGVRTKKKLSDGDSFTKCIQDAARETLPVLLPQKRRKLRRQLQQDRDNEWTSRAMEFEKAWEYRNLRRAYGLLKQYSDKLSNPSNLERTLQDLAEPASTVRS